MENGKSVQPVIRNLKDAGCSRRDIEQFLALYQAGRTQEQLALLALPRQKQLDKVHAEEKRINCLDYLVYQIRKQQTG